MPTVSSMTRQTEMLGQLSHKLFRLDMAAADNSILVGGTIGTNANLIQSEFGGQPALTTMVENYTEEKAAFRSELNNAMNNLQRASEQLKNSAQSEGESSQEVSSSEESGETESNATASAQSATNNVSSQERAVFTRAERPQIRHEQRPENNFQNFAQNYLVSENDDVDEQENSATQNENQDDRLTSMKNFVRDYNNVVSYLNENKISAPLSSLNQNSELKNSLNEIGVTVNSSGELAVNEKTLSEALQNNSEKVNSTLGSEGLAGQLEREVDRVNQQSENLFPTITDYVNRRETDLAAESLYSARNPMTAAYYGINAGNLINTFT